MVSSRHIHWLYEQLPELIEKGVLSPEGAAQLKQHYGEPASISSRSIAITLFSVIGGLLVGGGIILLLAHNWQELSRATRTVIALAPLLASLGLAAFTILRDKSIAWREGVTGFWILAIGAALALIEQTYHIPGEYETFLLRWLLLALPVVWLLRSSSGLVLYLIGITAWTPFAVSAFGSGLGYWPLLFAVLPMIVWRYRQNPESPGTSLIGWATAISLVVGVAMSLENVLEDLWPTIFALIFAALFLIGRALTQSQQLAIQRPFRFLGALGTVVLCLILTYEDPWRGVGTMPPELGQLFEAGNYGGTLVLGVLLAVLGVLFVRQRSWSPATDLAFLSSPVILFGASFAPDRTIALLVANAYLLVLGALCIGRGFHSQSLRYNNIGMSIVAALTLLRFFDSDIDMVVRGLAFIVVGLGFFFTNWNLVRRRRSTP